MRSESDPVEAILDLTGGVDYAFDAIGVRATMEQVLPVTRAGGRGPENHGGDGGPRRVAADRD